MIVNTGRGALVDTAAVIDGLKSGRIGSLGLDVYEEEAPLFFEDRSTEVITDDVFARLLTFPNVLLTAHQAFFTEPALQAIAATTLSNLDDLEAGKDLRQPRVSDRQVIGVHGTAPRIARVGVTSDAGFDSPMRASTGTHPRRPTITGLRSIWRISGTAASSAATRVTRSTTGSMGSAGRPRKPRNSGARWRRSTAARASAAVTGATSTRSVGAQFGLDSPGTDRRRTDRAPHRDRRRSAARGRRAPVTAR